MSDLAEERLFLQNALSEPGGIPSEQESQRPVIDQPVRIGVRVDQLERELPQGPENVPFHFGLQSAKIPRREVSVQGLIVRNEIALCRQVSHELLDDPFGKDCWFQQCRLQSAADSG